MIAGDAERKKLNPQKNSEIQTEDLHTSQLLLPLGP